jgi:hypothetical protein
MPETLERNINETVETLRPLESALSQMLNPSQVINEPELENDFQQLLYIAGEALKFRPPLYIQSILGPAKSWLPPHDQYSEFTIADLWQPLKLLDFLTDVSVPAFSHMPNRWVRTFVPPLVRSLFWRPSNYFQQTDPFDNETAFSKEHWFFINGVATNEAVAKINSDLISKMFLRPVTVVHNQTDSVLFDLVQCAIGKEFKTRPSLSTPQSMTEPVVKATIAILKALVDPERDKVVVICHSQGTIITANVIRALKVAIEKMRNDQLAQTIEYDSELGLHENLACDILASKVLEIEDEAPRADYLVSLLKKLEIYTFANCANKMTYVTYIYDQNGKEIGLPYIENFANEYDLVARLGVLSPLKEDPEIIKLDGMVYEKKGKAAWGHLLNEHYLLGIDGYLKRPDMKPDPYTSHSQDPSGSDYKPRLYGYFNGSRPKAYYIKGMKK